MPYYRERNRSRVEAIGAPSTVPIGRPGRFAGYAHGRFDGVPPGGDPGSGGGDDVRRGLTGSKRGPILGR